MVIVMVMEEEDRATPICMLPGQKKKVNENVELEPPTEMIKMEIKKKESELEKDSSSSSFNITIDFPTLILIGALFLASFLNTTHLGFLPESFKSNLFMFSVAKTFILFGGIILIKNYLFES